jgi:hypothetical protein
MDQEGRLHAFWEDITSDGGDIVHRVRNTDGSWDAGEFLFPAPGFSKHPVSAVDAFNRVHVVWVDARSGAQRLLHTFRDAGGGEWNALQVLSVGGTFPSEPSMGADGLGAVHVVWSDRGGGSSSDISFDIVYLSLEPEGAISPVRLIQHGGVAVRPFIEVMPDATLHLVWMDDRDVAHLGLSEIYYKRHLPGIGWGKDKRFSYDRTDHDRPIIVAGPSNTLNLAWEDYRTGSPDIFYRQITWETGWDRSATRLTADVSSSQSPTLVALSDGTLILLWADAQGTGVFRINTKEGHIGY